jgi:SAM-dependent methyltransferase
MTNTIARGQPCPSCQTDKWADQLEAADYHYGNDGKFRAVQCVTCGVWAQHPIPSAAELGSFYPETYYSFQSKNHPGLAHRLMLSLFGLKRRTYLPDSSRPGYLLDVGCGAGTYIEELAARGWKVAGVEPSASAVEAGKSRGLDITQGSIHDIAHPAESFDVVRLNHSFEHVPDPESVLRAALLLLKPGGALFIGVPNTAGLWPRIFGQYWWYLGLPVHTYGYNPANLTAMTRRAGFSTERIRYYSEFTGLLGSLQIWINRDKRPLTATGPLLFNKFVRLPGYWLCRFLDLLRMGDCIEYVGRKSGRK